MNSLNRRQCITTTLATVVILSFFGFVNSGFATVPGHRVVNHTVRLDGVGPDNPLIYDNDWWFDVFDNNYLWAQASLGKVNLRGNIVSRDMWDWDKGYFYPMQKCVDDADKALQLARDSGLRNIPNITRGADKVLRPPVSGKIEDTVPDDSPGCQLIIAEARRATPEKPLLIVSGGPLTTVANALLLAPDIAPNLVVFNILVSHYGYNGKDGWAAYIVARKTRYVDWGGRSFWDKNSVFTTKDFEGLPKNPFCDDMRRLIQSNLGQVNQLGDGAPLVWLFEPRCWTRAEVHGANWRGKAVEFQPAREGESGDVLVIPKAGTDLRRSRDEFFRVLSNPDVYRRDKAAGAQTPQAGLAVTALGKRYQPDPRRVVIQQSHADPGGSTSIRNSDRAHLEWKTNGYFQRNRDLGQVFTAPRDFQLDALVLRTGPSDAAVLAGTPGAKLFVQFFEVIGEPHLHDNGTPPGTEAKHGFSKNHRCDDYLTGVEYRPRYLVNGGIFPAVPPTRTLEGRPSDDDAGQLVYLRWRFTGTTRPGFAAGRRYAFMLGIEEPGAARGFTLANANAAGVNAPPSLTDAHDRYPGGWGLRREGDGTLPPLMLLAAQPPDDPAPLAQLHREALFGEGSARYSLSPTTDGFPDVDTYRDLEFYLEAADPSPSLVQHDLTPFHDAERALANPHKGWYHHYPDNHINKYEIARDADLLEFPGMDHLYIRLAWAYLEPREGQFDWAVIDRIIEKWTAHGLGIAFRISCKETSTDRVEQQFATPRWVMEAGAQGGHYRMGQATGSEGPWEPVFDDPIFLAKLDRFLAAFAARYDQQPWVRYVDIGSIGDWGEGHSWAGSRKEVGFAARKRHVDLHLKHFKRAQLVVSDDFVFALNDATERAALHRYVLTNGITYRDDSILVNGYLAGTSDRFTVRSPGFFADAYPHTPTVFELEHYGTVKRLGNWEGRPDSLVAKHGQGRTGPDYFRGALELLRATYLGYHGYAHEWLADNPEFTREMLNRCGYWLFPTNLTLPERPVTGTTIPITLTLENRGVAPPYQPYELRVKLSGAGTNWVRVMGQASKSWLPGTPVVCAYDLPLPAALPPGEYQVAIGLFDAAPAPARPVEFALQARLRDDEGYYRMATLKLTAPTPKD